MRRAGPSQLLPIALGAVFLAALAALAFLQYRWIGRVSEAEQERMRALLVEAASRFADGLDRELARAFRSFQPPDGLDDAGLRDELVTRAARWRSTSPDPALVRELLVVTRLDRDELEIRRLDEPRGLLLPATWEPDLDSLRRIFLVRGKVPLLDELLPGLILPVRPGPPPRDGEARDTERRRPPKHHVVVRLDRDALTRTFLPRLAEREFGGASGLAYGVTVVAPGSNGTVVFQAGPPMKAGLAPPDASRSLFSLRPFSELAGLPGRDVPAAAPPGPSRADRAADGDGAAPAGPEVGRWRLEVRHPAGSLESAVAGARRRNVAVSLAVLSLLALSIALLVVSTRRAQALARQQMEFVAAVSHELKTPLTAMRSAGQNLADGIVDDPERVRTYGLLIEREGRRLTAMVGRVLAFAGLRSGSQTFRAERVALRPLVDGVLADLRWVLDEKRISVENDLGASLPDALGDAQALRQAVANLVDNAVKYGGTARWIGIRARAAAGPRGEEVVLSVSDRGIGIRRADLPRLFDPFFRSEAATAAGIGGSGLGLAVVRGTVEAQGGRVTVDSAPGRGSTFSLHLPVARSEKGGEA